MKRQAIGEFVLTDPDMKVKPRGKIYSINEGYTNSWDGPIKEYVESKKAVSEPLVFFQLPVRFACRYSPFNG